MRPYPIGNGTVSPRVPREFVALMDALQFEGANTEALQELDDVEWRRLLDFCDLSHLALALFQLDIPGIPGWVKHRLEQNAADNAQRFERVRTAYAEAATSLVQAGVPHLVLKGFSQAPHYVSEPRLRYQSDIDIYCPEDQIDAARTAIMRLGYIPDPHHVDNAEADHVSALARPGNWQWRGNSYDPEMPPSIEIHFSLWNKRVTLIDLAEVQHFWERRVTRKLGKLEYPSLSPVDHLGYLALHILRGVLSGDWVIDHVYELATFLHSRVRDVEFWSQWYETHSMHLRSREVIAFSLARSWFSCILPEVVRAEMERLPEAQKHWLNRYGGAPLEVMFRRNKDGRLLQMLMSSHPRTRRSVLRKAFMPSRIQRLDGPTVRVQNRRIVAAGSANRYLDYLFYVVRKVTTHSIANAGLVLHSLKLWLSTRALSTQFWLFLGASFFLTWACRSSTSSSTCS